MATPKFDENSVEGIFSNKIWNYIKDHVNGKVFCNIINGTLQISIKQGYSTWRYDVKEIVDEIVNMNLTSQKCAEIILQEYKKFIFERANMYYFKKK